MKNNYNYETCLLMFTKRKTAVFILKKRRLFLWFDYGFFNDISRLFTAGGRIGRLIGYTLADDEESVEITVAVGYAGEHRQQVAVVAYINRL